MSAMDSPTSNTTTESSHVGRLLDTDAVLPAEVLQRAIVHAWQQLQETPSYVEQQMAQCRGFLESIAHQR